MNFLKLFLQAFNGIKADYSLGAYYFGLFSDYLVVNFGGQSGLETISDMEVGSILLFGLALFVSFFINNYIFQALQGVTFAVNQMVRASELPPKILIKIPADLAISDLKKIIKVWLLLEKLLLLFSEMTNLFEDGIQNHQYFV